MLRSCLTTCLFALAAGFAPTLRRQPPKMPLRTAAPRLCAADDVSKNLLFDTIDVENRPSLLAALEARDYLTIAFLAHGAYVSGLNIAGAYEGYTEQAIGVAAILGFLSAAWGWWSLLSGGIEEDNRPGFARERTIMWYTSTYLAGVMWLSVRLSPLYPTEQLAPLDPALCAATIAVYAYGLYAPVRTVLVQWEQLTPTEQLRMKGMVASGAIGGVFVLNTAVLVLRGPHWWEQVLLLYPGQSTLEPSTALFAAYAVEAGMLVHRLARRGLLTFKTAVPLYGFGVLPVLTLLPMGCLFWWKQADISFWKFLFDV